MRAVNVIVGSQIDPHVDAVISHMTCDPWLVDLESLVAGDVALGSGRAIVRHNEAWLELQLGGRGWIRRLAPAGWSAGVESETPDGVRLSGHFAALASLVRTLSVDWLTELETLIAAENKLVQQAAATRVGAPFPEAMVAPQPGVAVEVLGTDDLVVKPVGGSTLSVSGQPRSLITTALADIVEGEYLNESMIYQKRITARRHLRVVTVREHASVFALPVRVDTPLDWRVSAEAHQGFERAVDETIGSLACDVAFDLGAGYSSQDWIDDGETCWLVDVNPAGQWLFLPDEGEIAQRIADWLDGSSTGAAS